MNFRSLEVRASTINEADRSIEVLLTTETPVAMYDWDRYERVMEVLLTSGAQLPSSRQVPLLESHHRYTTDDQLGSVRDLKATPEGVVGRAVFSSLADSQWTKVKEGHVTDVSAGYQVLERVYVPKGSTSTVQGKTYTGPINIATKWKLREGSITPIGADEQAKLRGLDPSTLRNFHEGESFMNEELRALCVERGMPTDATEEQAAKFLADMLRKDKEAAAIRAASAAPLKPVLEPPAERTAEKGADYEAIVRKVVAENEAKREAWRTEVNALCDLAGFDGDRVRLYEHKDAAGVRKALLDAKAERSANVPFGYSTITFGEAQRDKHRSDVGTALTIRCLQNSSCGEESAKKVYPEDKRSKNWQQFQHARLLDIAAECLRMDGMDPRGLSTEQLAIAAMGWPEKVGLRSAMPAYHTTGSFSILTQDAVNKSMQVGYMEAPSTWEGPMRRAASVPDFKTIHRMRIGAIPNLPVWPDNTSPESASFANAEETYAVEARSIDVSFSWRLLVNDDMDSLSRTPAQMGAAARRTVNTVAWAAVTSNPTMSDGVALFAAATGARKRTNLTTGAGAPSVTTVQTLRNLMRQMRGENTPEGNESADILNLTPKYIVGPSALETTIEQLVKSAYDPTASTFMVHNNANSLIPVIEPLLDVVSTTAWYLFASPSQIDTVELTFLQGQESPVTRDWVDEKSLSHYWAIVQTYAAKAMNHRGMQQHAGA